MESNPVSRREFASWLAAAGACAAGATVRGDEPPGKQGADAKQVPAAKAGIADEKPTEKPLEKPVAKPTDGTPAEHALRILLARFPDERLDAAAQVSLLVDLERHQVRSRVLSSVELANGDEPGAPFRAIVRRD